MGGGIGALVGASGSYISGSLLANVAFRGTAGALGNAVGQGQSIGDPCFRFNVGSFAGSAAGGALSGLVAPAAYATAFAGPLATQVVHRTLAGTPAGGVSATLAVIGTHAGASGQNCSCGK